MTSQRFASGAFVFTRARGSEPRAPDDLPPLAAQHGFPSHVIPAYPGDRVALGRAITAASAGLAREGFLLRPITRTSNQVVYGIVKEARDEAEQKLDHEFEATVAWSLEPDPGVVHGDHPVAQRVAAAYHELRGKITADDWSASITSFLDAHDAARVRGDGRVYWVPPQRLDEVRRFGGLLAAVGIDLVLAEIEAESRTVVEHVAQDSLDEQIAQLEQEAEQFDGTQRPSTYERRLEEYQRLRERAVLYRDALGVGVDRAAQVLTDLEQKVTAMLDLRKQTVVHRNGTTSADASPAEASGTPTCITFGGGQFTLATAADDELTFTSGDDYAVAAIRSLEAMGLAGRWQSAGQARVKISNSGPPGADVKIAIKLPAAQPLRKHKPALAALGIELAD